MMTREEALAYGMSFYNVYEEKPFRDPNWQLVRIKGSKKTFLWIYEREGYINLNVKVNPEWRDFWRSAYESVTAGYHLNKEHWNTIILDGTIPEEEIKRMIAESYDLVTDSPTKRIYEAVKRIPKGHVATYGKIAEMAAALIAFSSASVDTSFVGSSGVAASSASIALFRLSAALSTVSWLSFASSADFAFVSSD